jgi:hypothetical protein
MLDFDPLACERQAERAHKTRHDEDERSAREEGLSHRYLRPIEK